MHELSIALSLVESVESAARQAGAQRVTRIQLQLGALSGVVKEALLFSYDIAAQGTLAEGATLDIEEVPLTVHCSTCDQTHVLPLGRGISCPTCGSLSTCVVRGKELEVTAIEVEVPEEVLDGHTVA
ncbi:MAG: hydrogenase maturation nickel metallochaperone HypA [Anaerolineae bacterium]|nr:hydrogenase maturation nickel metallochaperone HypA [Anaerolineae bacterium]